MSDDRPLRIRAATEADAEAIASIYAPYVRDTAISFELTPPSAEEMRKRIIDLTRTHPWLVAEDDGRIAGYAYAGQHNARAAYDWSANVSVYLHPDYHRRGLGAKLYRSLFKVLRAQGYHSLYALITVPNAASVAVHRSLGLSEIGVLREVGFKGGAWHDVLWMGVTLGDRFAPPGPPTPFATLAAIDVILEP